jgi:DNA repair photolyase
MADVVRKAKLGPTAVEYLPAASILSQATGFIDAFDYTLNPYAGCSFGCTYCYAAFFARTDELKDNWGKWVQVKENALALLVKKRRKPLKGAAIYMSSVTDPYQPIEKELALSRAILEELLTYHEVRLVVQTRGPLVVRDIDLLRRFEHAQVNMTITTDDDEVRRTFEPHCASTQRRLDTIRQIHEAGIETCITMTPLLPVASPHDFAAQLRATGVHRFVVQAFHATKSRFVAGTGQAALELSRQMDWTPERYQEVVTILRQHLPEVREGKSGFTPYWLDSTELA